MKKKRVQPKKPSMIRYSYRGCYDSIKTVIEEYGDFYSTKRQAIAALKESRLRWLDQCEIDCHCTTATGETPQKWSEHETDQCRLNFIKKQKKALKCEYRIITATFDDSEVFEFDPNCKKTARLINNPHKLSRHRSDDALGL